MAGILHAATFCWVGGDSGEWRNSASWTDENGNSVSAFPERYDTAIFSSIDSVTITDEITASDVGVIQAENTDLTFKENVYFRGTSVAAKSLTMEKEAQFLGSMESITTVGEQIYSGNCVINRENLSLSGSKVTFGGSVEKWASAAATDERSITITGNAVLAGEIRNLHNFTITGKTTLTGTVAITADTVSFGSTVDSDSDTAPRELKIIGNAVFAGNVGATAKLSMLEVGGTTTTSGDISFTAEGSTVPLMFAEAFSGSATMNSRSLFSEENTFGSLTLNAPATFSKSNGFSSLTVGSGTQTFDITITFAGGTTQTVSGTLSCKGTSANYVTLTSGGTWTYSGAASAGNFDYTYIENSAASTALSITPSTKHLSEKTAASTTNWFAFKYYWIGAASISWSEPTNWAIDEDGTIPLESDENAPSSTDGTSEITVLKGSSTMASPYMLTFSADANIKSLAVNENATVDFADNDFTCSDDFKNAGTVRIGDSISLSFGTVIPASGSTVEYYGDFSASFAPLSGVDGYDNLIIDGTEITASAIDITVRNSLVIRNGGKLVCKSLAVAEETSLSDNSKITSTGNFSSDGDVTIADGGEISCAYLNAKSGAAISGTAVAKLSGTYGQEYGDAFVFDSGTVTLCTGDGSGTVQPVKFGGDVSGAGELTIKGAAGPVAGGAALSFSTSSSASSVAEVDFEQGFASGVKVELNCSATIKGTNSFSSLEIGDGTQAFPLVVQFEAGKTQTIGTISSRGAGSTNTVQLKSTTDGSEWNACFSSIPSDSDFSYTIVRDSHSVDSSGSDNDLNLIPSAATVLDWQPSNLTCACWFTYTYYWTGAEDSNWKNAKNWSCSPADGAAAAPGYPAFSGGTSEITVLKGSSTTASPFILTLTDNVNIKSFTVNENATVDFATYDFTATSTGTNPLVNNGTVRIGGNVTVTAASVENGDDSAVEYYGSSLTQLGWGSSYRNLEFSDGASCASSAAMTVSGTLKIYNGDGNEISLAGANVFSNPVEIGSSVDSLVQAGNVTLNAASGLEIASGANCTSLDIKCGAVLKGAVTTEGAQEYEGDASFSGNVIAASVDVGGDCVFGAGGTDIMISTGGTQRYGGKTTLSSKTTVNAGSAAVSFVGNVDGAYPLEIGNGTDSTSSVFSGNVGSATPLESLVAYGDAEFARTASTTGCQTYNGSLSFSASSGCSVVAGGEIFIRGDVVASGSAAIGSSKAVVADGSADRTWSGTLSFCPSGSGAFIDVSGGGSLSVTGSVSFGGGLYVYAGDVALSSASVAGDFAVFGNSYSADDPRYSGADTRFSFYGIGSLEYQPSSFSASLSFASSASLSVGGNMYVNGADISGVSVSVPDNSSSHPVFNSGDSATQNQWGIPYAVFLNSAVSGVAVSGGWISASAGAQGCSDGGGNSNVAFTTPYIERAYSVYDDVVCIEFSEDIENSHGEIRALVESSPSSLSGGGIWYDGGAIAFSGAFSDSDCATPLPSGDVRRIFLKTTGEKWNTDADGLHSQSLSASENSTDRSGTHRETKIDISMVEGVVYGANGHVMGTNYGAHLEGGSSAPSFTATEDCASPVLVAVSTGQENHVGASDGQKMYDAHNFIEFRYSEPVDIGTMLHSSSWVNVPATVLSSSVSSSFGGAISENASGGISISGFADIAEGSVVAGVKSYSGGGWSGTVDSALPHSLYRSFATSSSGAEENHTHRFRICVAGIVDEANPVVVGGTEFFNYLGYIESAETPSGSVTPRSNAYVVDSSPNKNEIDPSGSANHPLPSITVNGSSSLDSSLYGSWDVSHPTFAPYSTTVSGGSASWDAGDSSERKYELIGSVNSSTNPYLENIEIHLFDDTHDYSGASAYKWLSRTGWVTGSDRSSVEFKAPDETGGSRAFTPSGKGGIRRSSLHGAESAFTYAVFGTGAQKEFGSGIKQVVKSSLFSYVDTEDFSNNIAAETSDDGLYISIPLNPSDTELPRRTTFVVTYTPGTMSSPNSFITDLAGNRLVQTDGGGTKTLCSVDVTPPDFSLSLAPIGTDKLCVFFTKPLAYNSVRFSLLPESVRRDCLAGIARNFEIADSGTGATEDDSPFTSAEIALDTEGCTAIVLTFAERMTALSDVERLWIRVNDVVSDVIDWSGGASAFIQDESGNGIVAGSCHAISDFAVNAVNVLYAHTEKSDDDDGWRDRGIYGVTADSTTDYTAHDFSADAGNYGTVLAHRDVTMQVQLVGGKSDGVFFAPENGESPCLVPDVAREIKSEWVCDKLNKLSGADWRVWLPFPLDSVASSYNSSPLSSPSCTAAGDSAGLLWNFVFPDSDYSFSSGDACQFVFKIQKGGSDVTIDHDGDPTTDEIPLCALWMPEDRISAGEFTFLDLWSFSLKDIKKQRGGVTILNNAINASNGENTVIEVDVPEEGNLNVYVLTLDGNVVRRLSKGRVQPGTRFFQWDGKNSSGKEVARGMYFVRVTGCGIDETRKVLVVK